MRIALLGAGHIGQTIARLLHATGDYQVTVLDKNPAYLKTLAAEGIAAYKLFIGETAPNPASAGVLATLLILTTVLVLLLTPIFCVPQAECCELAQA